MPNTSGLDLGASNQLWDAFVRNLNVTTLVSNSVNPSQTGMIRLAAGDIATIRNFANTQDLNLFSKNVNDVLALGGSAGISTSGPLAVTGATTLTGATSITGNLTVTGNLSLSGTLQGSGATMSKTLKKGTGNGTDYTTTSASYGDIDATNLSFTVTIPNGWKLEMEALTSVYTATNTAFVNLAFFDSVANAVIYEGGLATQAVGSNGETQMVLKWLLNGDGVSHTIKLQHKTSAGTLHVLNSSSTVLPVMVFTLLPSS